MACNQHFQFPDISFAYCYAFLFLLFHKIYNLCYPQLVGAIAFNSGRHQSKNIYEIIKNFSGWNRSVFDLLHFRDWFQIKMNLNRSQLSCLWKQKTAMITAPPTTNNASIAAVSKGIPIGITKAKRLF